MYEKSFSANITTTSTFVIGTISDLRVPISMNGVVVRSTGGALPISSYVASDNYDNVFWSEDDKTVCIQSKRKGTIYITVRYLK